MPPDLPDHLVEQLQSGRCVLVVGAGIAQALKKPTWHDVLTLVAAEVMPEDPALRPESTMLMAADELELLAELLGAEVGQQRIATAIHDALRRLTSLSRTPDWVSSLADLPFAAVISLNWDDGLEQALVRRAPLVVLPDKIPADADGAQSRNLRILKPLGHWDRISSLLLSLSEFDRSYGDDSEFGHLLGATLATHTALFAGVDPSTINGLFASAGMGGQPAEHPHYAVLDDDSALDARLIRARYNVHRLASPDLGRFTISLAAAVAARPAHRPPPSAGPLRELRLENIGPFKTLHVRFASEWTVLLGDNGTGKSTVLRALAFVLSGSSVLHDEADSLLRAGATDGVIQVTVGGTTYSTTLVRERAGVRIKTSVPTPVETGELLALGFPAFRGLSQKAPSGPRQERTIGVGHPSDLHALRTGNLDARLDDVQQWLINLAVVAEGGDRLGDADRAGRQIASVFDLWQRLMPGVPIVYAGLDKARWDVLVRSGSSTVPLRTFSQGALSTVAWAGTLARRLVDRFGGLDDRTNVSALLIVDEFDAHLHPEWQRLIVPRLREALPNVQVVATTHSPLIAGALGPGEVLTLHRDKNGRGRAEEAPQFRGWRADQILTSAAFGLDTSRDAETERDLDEYQAALGDGAVDREHVERLAALPRSGETALEREAADLVDAGLRERLAELPDEQRAALVQQATAYLRRVRGSGA